MVSETARIAVEAGRKRQEENEVAAGPPEFINVKITGKGEASKLYEGPNPGMIFKTGEEGLGVLQRRPVA